MARRKKEPQNVHRKNIATAAQKLFMEKGMKNTSMSDIAREAEYSKATLYVYFKNKEELISVLVLESMQKLYDYINMAIEKNSDSKKCYMEICHALLRYQEEYPLYFNMVLENIKIDFETTDFLPEEKETFLIGEQINELLAVFLEKGIAKGQIRPDIQILPTIFSIWGMISGLIQIATNKKEYIEQQMGLSKADFLAYGFETLYRAIAV